MYTVMRIKNEMGVLSEGYRQEQATKELLEYLDGDKNKFGPLKQVVTAAFDGDLKATGGYTFDDHPVLHVSHGVAGTNKTVSLFCYEQDAQTVVTFAMGEHLNATTYEITLLWQPGTDFGKDKKITLRRATGDGPAGTARLTGLPH